MAVPFKPYVYYKMNWKDKIDTITFNDAWGTLNTYFPTLNINYDEFAKRCENGQYLNLTIKQYINMKPENSGLHRLNAITIEEAYIDKPRGTADLDSVLFHMTTCQLVSPIVLLKTNNHLIKLDGVHRLVVSHFIKSDLRILIV